MTVLSEMLGRRLGLIAPQSVDVAHERDLRVPMDDGTILLADRWVAADRAGEAQPTVLVRSPYGRRAFVGLMFGRLLAERGLQVLVQSVRGTFGSEGRFSPFDERADGLATLRWLRAQPWHAGRIGTMGPSYLGLVQWALAAQAGPDLAAMAIQVSASQFYDQSWPGGAISLENTASWMVFIAMQEGRLAPVTINRALRRLPTVMGHLPLGELDVGVTGGEVDWFREAFQSSRREDDYWRRRDYSSTVVEVTAPVNFVGGWYDILLPWMLRDFCALQDAGHRPRLTVGPWTHTAPALAARGHREGIAWLRAHLLDDDRLLSGAAIRIYVTGERAGGGWRELERWPPADTGERALFLAADGQLRESPAAADQDGALTGYRYDPADPTPAVGGPVLLARHAVLDNRELESRPDVVTFTTEPLAAPVEAIGDASVAIWVRADAPSFDVFARVCDVDAEGASWNVCDGLVRVAPPAGDGAQAVAVTVPLWPLAHRFAAGHRIRLQVASGAHPRYARNPGTGEDPITATELRVTAVQVLHDREHPSTLRLPDASVHAPRAAVTTAVATA